MLQGKMGNVVFSLVAMCPTTPWELHYQKEEAEIGYWEISLPTTSVLGRRGPKRSWEVFKAGRYHVFKKHLSSDGPSSSVASNLGAVVVTGEGGDPP